MVAGDKREVELVEDGLFGISESNVLGSEDHCFTTPCCRSEGVVLYEQVRRWSIRRLAFLER